MMFIPLAIYLLAACVGLVAIVLALIGLRKDAAKSPVVVGMNSRKMNRSSFWKKALTIGGVEGAVLLLFGALGVWSSRVSIGWAADAVEEWSDGRAPMLEPQIRKRCVPFVLAGKTSGLAVVVVTPTNATTMTFGRPSLSAQAPVRADTLFEIGSITKTFTGLALAREIERREVRLEQPVQELLPPGVELPEAARAITLRHLTTHSSGFPRLAANSSGIWGGIGMIFFGTDPYASFTEAKLLEAVRTVELEFKPGTKSAYSNFGMMLLGYLLAARAGLGYEALIQRDVCQPLGMSNTVVTLEAAQAARFAQGYRAMMRLGPVVLGLRSAPWFEKSSLGGAGALRSTAADMEKYLQANFSPEGQPIEQALRESHRELFKVDEREAYGMNWIITQGQTLKQPVVWHNGGTGGFSSFLGIAKRSRVGVVVLSNSGEPVDDLASDILRDLAKAAQ